MYNTAMTSLYIQNIVMQIASNSVFFYSKRQLQNNWRWIETLNYTKIYTALQLAEATKFWPESSIIKDPSFFWKDSNKSHKTQRLTMGQLVALQNQFKKPTKAQA